MHCINLFPFIRWLRATTTTTTLWPKVGPWLLPVSLRPTHTCVLVLSLLLSYTARTLAVTRAIPLVDMVLSVFKRYSGATEGRHRPLEIHCSRLWLQGIWSKYVSPPPRHSSYPVTSMRERNVSLTWFHYRRALTSKSKEECKHALLVFFKNAPNFIYFLIFVFLQKECRKMSKGSPALTQKSRKTGRNLHFSWILKDWPQYMCETHMRKTSCGFTGKKY